MGCTRHIIADRREASSGKRGGEEKDDMTRVAILGGRGDISQKKTQRDDEKEKEKKKDKIAPNGQL